MSLKKKEKKGLFKRLSKSIDKKFGTSKIREGINDFLEIPPYLISNSTRITTMDNKNLLIEGYKNVEDYYSHYIKVYTNNLIIMVDGKSLDIKEITNEDLIITGDISSINYQKRGNI